jgi:hypothetical protein
MKNVTDFCSTRYVLLPFGFKGLIGIFMGKWEHDYERMNILSIYDEMKVANITVTNNS